MQRGLGVLVALCCVAAVAASNACALNAGGAKGNRQSVSQTGEGLSQDGRTGPGWLERSIARTLSGE